MEALARDLIAARDLIESLVWTAICAGLLIGLALQVKESVHAALSWVWRHFVQRQSVRLAALLLTGVVAAVAPAGSASAAAPGWWWSPPANPGFDQNTVIHVAGSVQEVNLVSRGGPSTLRVQAGQETFTIVLCPGWYLADLQADIRSGDGFLVEGSKMMDPWGHLHVVAARVTDRRTGQVLELRDETGWPRWMPGRPAEKAR